MTTTETTQTTAEQVAAQFHDGQTYETADGRTLDEVCRAAGSGRPAYRDDQHTNDSETQRAYEFPDGSAIVDAHGDAWDVRDPDCVCGFCWEGGGCDEMCQTAGEFISCDLRGEAIEAARKGNEIERLTGQDGNIATEVLVVDGRAGIVTNGNAIWGDWDGARKTLTTDDGLTIDVNGREWHQCECGQILEQACESDEEATIRVDFLPAYQRGTAKASNSADKMASHYTLCRGCAESLEEAQINNRPASKDDPDLLLGECVFHWDEDDGHGTLIDSDTAEEIGPATREQAKASASTGSPEGHILIDADGGVVAERGPGVRRVYVQP